MNEPASSPQRSVIPIERTSLWIGPAGESSERGWPGHDWAPLLLIVGCSRSGTTWLYRMLRRLPDVMGIGEAKAGIAARISGRSGNERLALFGTRRPVLDKTPANVYELEFLARVEGARAIHLVRDPRAVAASMRDAAGTWAAAGAAFSVARAARLWSRAVDEAERARRWWGERLVTLRYEDLLDDPSTQLKVAAQALGVEANKLAIHRSVLSESFAQRVRRIRSGAGQFVRFGERDRWRHELDAEDIAAVDAVIGDRRFARFGYRRGIIGDGAS